MPKRIVGRDQSTEYQGGADDEESADGDVCVSVSDAVKDRVMFKQELEPIHIHIHREDEQEECDRDRKSTPRRQGVGDLPLRYRLRHPARGINSTLNRLVVGSIPTASTKYINNLHSMGSAG